MPFAEVYIFFLNKSTERFFMQKFKVFPKFGRLAVAVRFLFIIAGSFLSGGCCTQYTNLAQYKAELRHYHDSQYGPDINRQIKRPKIISKPGSMPGKPISPSSSISTKHRYRTGKTLREPTGMRWILGSMPPSSKIGSKKERPRQLFPL